MISKHFFVDGNEIIEAEYSGNPFKVQHDDTLCNLGEINLPSYMYGGFDDRHSASYRAIGFGVQSLASLYPPSEPMSPKERRKKFNDGVRNMFNKGKKW